MGIATAIATVVALSFASATGWLADNGSVLWQGIVSGLLLGGVYGLVAIGLTLIFGVLDIVNFAHGAFLTLGMYVSFQLVTRVGVDPYLTLVVAVPLLAAFGYFVERALVGPTMGQRLENQLLLTVGFALVIENVLQLVFSSTPTSIELSYADAGAFPLRVFGAVVDLPRLVACAAALVLSGGLFILLRRTRLGMTIRAVASNPTAAQIVGVDLQSTYALTFALGIACAGAAGVLVLPFLSLEPTAGSVFNIIAFVVVVIGGLGSVTGALLGGFIIGLTQEVSGVLIPGQSKLLSVFVVFVLTLLLRPQGLMGSRG